YGGFLLPPCGCEPRGHEASGPDAYAARLERVAGGLGLSIAPGGGVKLRALGVPTGSYARPQGVRESWAQFGLLCEFHRHNVTSVGPYDRDYKISILVELLLPLLLSGQSPLRAERKGHDRSAERTGSRWSSSQPAGVRVLATLLVA